jgi:hyperosmotically inducible periplasmic protein
MRHSTTIRKALFAAALVAGFGAIPFAQVSAQESPAQAQMHSDNQTVPDKAADGWITTKVKSELATAKNIKSTDIDVTTTDGVVTLAGTVQSDGAKTKAVNTAKKVKGVKNVDASGLTVDATAAK